MDSAQNAIGALLGALTVGFFFYYTTHRQLGEAMGLSIGVVTFALMLILETILIMARFYLSEHKEKSHVCNKETILSQLVYSNRLLGRSGGNLWNSHLKNTILINRVDLLSISILRN